MLRHIKSTKCEYTLRQQLNGHIGPRVRMRTKILTVNKSDTEKE